MVEGLIQMPMLGSWMISPGSSQLPAMVELAADQ
jgi:hypothetical protein